MTSIEEDLLTLAVVEEIVINREWVDLAVMIMIIRGEGTMTITLEMNTNQTTDDVVIHHHHAEIQNHLQQSLSHAQLHLLFRPLRLL